MMHREKERKARQDFMRGIDLFNAGRPVEHCVNAAQRAGWSAARTAVTLRRGLR